MNRKKNNVILYTLTALILSSSNPVSAMDDGWSWYNQNGHPVRNDAAAQACAACNQPLGQRDNASCRTCHQRVHYGCLDMQGNCFPCASSASHEEEREQRQSICAECAIAVSPHEPAAYCASCNQRGHLNCFFHNGNLCSLCRALRQSQDEYEGQEPAQDDPAQHAVAAPIGAAVVNDAAHLLAEVKKLEESDGNCMVCMGNKATLWSPCCVSLKGVSSFGMCKSCLDELPRHGNAVCPQCRKPLNINGPWRPRPAEVAAIKAAEAACLGNAVAPAPAPAPAPVPIQAPQFNVHLNYYEVFRFPEGHPAYGRRIVAIQIPNGDFGPRCGYINSILVHTYVNQEPAYDTNTGSTNFYYVNPDNPLQPAPLGLFYWVLPSNAPPVIDRSHGSQRLQVRDEAIMCNKPRGSYGYRYLRNPNPNDGQGAGYFALRRKNCNDFLKENGRLRRWNQHHSDHQDEAQHPFSLRQGPDAGY